MKKNIVVVLCLMIACLIGSSTNPLKASSKDTNKNILPNSSWEQTTDSWTIKGGVFNKGNHTVESVEGNPFEYPFTSNHWCELSCNEPVEVDSKGTLQLSFYLTSGEVDFKDESVTVAADITVVYNDATTKEYTLNISKTLDEKDNSYKFNFKNDTNENIKTVALTKLQFVNDVSSIPFAIKEPQLSVVN